MVECGWDAMKLHYRPNLRPNSRKYLFKRLVYLMPPAQIFSTAKKAGMNWFRRLFVRARIGTLLISEMKKLSSFCLTTTSLSWRHRAALTTGVVPYALDVSLRHRLLDVYGGVEVVMLCATADLGSVTVSLGRRCSTSPCREENDVSLSLGTTWA